MNDLEKLIEDSLWDALKRTSTVYRVVDKETGYVDAQVKSGAVARIVARAVQEHYSKTRPWPIQTTLGG